MGIYTLAAKCTNALCNCLKRYVRRRGSWVAYTGAALIAGSIPFGQASACDDSSSGNIYQTNLQTQSNEWDTATSFSNGEEGLTASPDKSSLSAILYNGDFFDSVNVCISLSMAANGTEYGSGLVFWARDYDHYYLFEIDPIAGTFYVGRRIGNQQAFPIASKPGETIHKGVNQLNDISIILDGDKATFFINGSKVGSAIGQNWMEGNKLGLIAESPEENVDTWRFKDFVVSKINK